MRQVSQVLPGSLGSSVLMGALLGAMWLPPGSAQAQQAQAGVQASPSATAVVTVVQVPSPWYAPRFVIASKMRSTIAQYQQINGLAFKTYSFARDSGDFGGIYFWQDKAAAQAWFTPEWFARVQKERGSAGNVRYFEAPV